MSSVSDVPDPEDAPVCLSCRAVLHGEYCHQCGQRDVDLDRGLWLVLADALSETFEADGRLPRTILPFFFQPGAVVRSWLSGRRSRWASPVRTYVFALFVAFLAFGFRAHQDIEAVSVAPLAEAPVQEDGSRLVELGESEVSLRLEGEAGSGQALLDMPQQQVVSSIVEALLVWLPRLITLHIPLFAGVLQLLYWHRRYLDHLVFSIDQHSRGLLLLALPTALGSEPLSWIAQGVMAVHLLGALRVVYGAPWRGTIARFVALVATTTLTFVVGAMVIVVMTLIHV
jgi:hypothetical protein